MAMARFRRGRPHFLLRVAVLTFVVSLSANFTGCGDSDSFEFMKDDRQMSRSGQYGAGMADAERLELQERYARKLEEQATPTSGGSAP